MILTLVVAVLVGGLGFYGGTLYQKGQRGSFTPGQFPGGIPSGINGTQNRTGNTNQGSKPVSGEITAMDNESITVKTSDGGSKIILISNSTKINKSLEGSKTDLSKGVTVTTMGTTNTDGSITAQMISIGNTTTQGGPQGAPPGGNNPPNQ